MSNAVAAAIASICNGVSVTVNGVTLTVKGIDPPPAQLSGAKLPCVYALTGAAEYDTTSYGADVLAETRQYAVQCAVEAWEQTNRETRETWSRALIAALRDRLAQYPNLDGCAGVQSATPTGDTGATTIQDTLNGTVKDFVGFEITLQVSELISRTYAAGE